MRRVAFAIQMEQDLYLSAGFVRLLREANADVETTALVLADALRDPAGLLEGFDRVEHIGSCFHPHPLRAPFRLRSILRYRSKARALRFRADDVLVAYSFREFALNVLVASLAPRPTLVAVRKPDADAEALLTRRRTLLSLYWNAWNRVFGASTQRYRWLPTSNRIGAGTFRHPFYDHEFTLEVPGAPSEDAGSVPYPFALLRGEPGDADRPVLVFLGEKYPFEEQQDPQRLREAMVRVADATCAAFPGHRLVFKPRVRDDAFASAFRGFEIDYEDIVLEGLLIEVPEIDVVLSFKSSGSLVAGLYGCAGALLYPLVELSPEFRATLDGYFEAQLDVLTVVDDLSRLGDLAAPPAADHAAIAAGARGFLDLLAPA